MIAYITKYALTQGIQKLEGEVSKETPTMFCANQQRGSFGPTYFHGDDWHRTIESAMAKAEWMRVKRIKTSQENIAKLENLKFTIPE